MEIFAIILSSLLGAVAPSGLVIDTVIAQRVLARAESTERLEVRVDNTPSYDAINGKVERVRIAARGITFSQLRLDTLELETDPIDIDLESLQQEEGDLSSALRQPVQAGVRMILTEEDINDALRSPDFSARFQQIISNLAVKIPGANATQYQLTNAQVKLLSENRLRFQGDLQFADSEPGTMEAEQTSLKLVIELGLELDSATQVQLIDPTISINGSPLPSFLTRGVVDGLSNSLDLRRLEATGLVLRLLDLEIDENKMQVAAFIRFKPHLEK